MKKKYILIVSNSNRIPEVMGPYTTEEKRLKVMQELANSSEDIIVYYMDAESKPEFDLL